MAYADLLENEGVTSQFLAVLKPRRLADTATWTNVSATIYKQSFDFGQIVQVFDGVTEKDEATSASLSDGDWYYNFTNEEIYLDIGSDPSSNNIVCVYEIYTGTFDAHFNRIPTDSATRVVYFEPIVTKSPRIVSSSDDSLFGIFSTRSTSIRLSNATHILEKHLYDSSFHDASVDVYHYLDELSTANTKLVYQGLVRAVNYSDNNVTFSLLDRTAVFDNEYRNPVGTSFYTAAQFSDLDPDFLNRPIRRVYGVVDGFIPVNIDYVADSPTTSDNRRWIAIQDETNLGSVSTTVLSSPSSTTTRTYLTSADGFRVGDSVWKDDTATSSNDEYFLVTAVNKTGDHYIEHAAVTDVAVNGDTIKRSFIGRVDIIKESVKYTALYGRDYTEYTDGTNKVAGFDFDTSLESNLSIPSTLSTLDIVHCRVYGNTNTVTLGGPAFGSDSADTGNLTQAVVILFDLMKNSGLSESDIDTSTFTTLQGTVSDQFGFAIPARSSNNFPRYKDLFGEFTESLMLRLYRDDNNTWTISQAGPAGSADKTLEDDEIIEGSFNYNFDYRDLISLAIARYRFREISDKNNVTDTYDRVTKTSFVSRDLHKVTRQKTFTSLHFKESEAQTLADRLSYLFGDRMGELSIKTKNRFFDSELSDIVTVTRDRLPGFDFVKNTDRSRDFVITSTEKSLNNVSITLTDQKGVEDNSGSW